MQTKQNDRSFKKGVVSLHFNKEDVFSNKLKEFPLQNVFNDYNGGNDYEATVNFICDLFFKPAETLILPKHKRLNVVVCHSTNMTDTEHARAICEKYAYCFFGEVIKSFDQIKQTIAFLFCQIDQTIKNNQNNYKSNQTIKQINRVDATCRELVGIP